MISIKLNSKRVQMSWYVIIVLDKPNFFLEISQIRGDQKVKLRMDSIVDQWGHAPRT